MNNILKPSEAKRKICFLEVKNDGNIQSAGEFTLGGEFTLPKCSLKLPPKIPQNFPEGVYPFPTPPPHWLCN